VMGYLLSSASTTAWWRYPKFSQQRKKLPWVLQFCQSWISSIYLCNKSNLASAAAAIVARHRPSPQEQRAEKVRTWQRSSSVALQTWAAQSCQSYICYYQLFLLSIKPWKGLLIHTQLYCTCTYAIISYSYCP
jgi:hypothetical protein